MPMPVAADQILHLTPEDYHVIRPEDFGAPGLQARESIGPFVDVQALGALVTVHDSTFEAHRGIGHHPHQGMERLFYILEGSVDHDDALNHITGHIGTGDLGILTEGRRGMIHSEWNNSDGRARAYILVYPTEPTPASASFAAIRDEEAPRRASAEGAHTKQVVARGDGRLHGDLRELGDSTLAGGSTLEIAVGADEAGLLFVVGGAVRVADVPAPVRRDHTVLVAPGAARTLRVEAHVDCRILHALTGPGHGLRRR
jgi:redox-sensitive bicupin YhaK (pirin superfamily)